MFYLASAKVMQMGLPMLILLQILGDMFRKQNVSGISAVHHPLRHVNSGAGNVRPFVDINDTADRPAVHTHSQWQIGMCFQRAANVQRTFQRRLRTVVKNQRHSVSGRNLDELPLGFRTPKFIRASNNLIERIEQPSLVIDQSLRITNDVHEQDMSDLQLNFLFDFAGHKDSRRSALPRSSTSTTC